MGFSRPCEQQDPSCRCFLIILIIVLPVFLVIGLGFGLKMARLVDGSFLYQLNRLVYFLALPALLFHEIARADFSATFNGMLLAGMLAAILLTFFLAYGFAAWRGYPPEARGSFCQGAFRGNIAYIGLAIVFNAYGGDGLAAAGILLGFLVPVYNFSASLPCCCRTGSSRASSSAPGSGSGRSAAIL